MQYTKSKLPAINLKFAMLVLILAVSACSQKTDNNKMSVSGDRLSAPLPAALLTVDASNLLVDIYDGGKSIPCTGLTVNQVKGTFSCSATLSAGSHSISLKYFIKDSTYGIVLVQTSSAISITVTAGETTTADFSLATITDIDSDGDGISNLAELNAGTNPFTTCKLDNSNLNECTLG